MLEQARIDAKAWRETGKDPFDSTTCTALLLRFLHQSVVVAPCATATPQGPNVHFAYYIGTLTAA